VFRRRVTGGCVGHNGTMNLRCWAAVSLSVWLAACTMTSAPTPRKPPRAAGRLNPRTADGDAIYLGFGHHHPDCFSFTPSTRPDTATVPCPEGVLRLLGTCRSGDLLRGATGCQCVPLSDDPPRTVVCPE